MPNSDWSTAAPTAQPAPFKHSPVKNTARDLIAVFLIHHAQLPLLDLPDELVPDVLGHVRHPVRSLLRWRRQFDHLVRPSVLSGCHLFHVLVVHLLPEDFAGWGQRNGAVSFGLVVDGDVAFLVEARFEVGFV